MSVLPAYRALCSPWRPALLEAPAATRREPVRDAPLRSRAGTRPDFARRPPASLERHTVGRARLVNGTPPDGGRTREEAPARALYPFDPGGRI